MLDKLLALDGWSIRDQEEDDYVLSAPDDKFYVLFGAEFLWENEPALVVVTKDERYACWAESNVAWYESGWPVKICDILC